MNNLALWACFALGAVLYIMKRAYYSVQGPDHTVGTYGAYFAKWGIPIVFRFALGAAIFWSWASYPDLLTTIVKMLGFALPLTIPKYPVVALLLGLFVDWGLDWLSTKVPFLKNYIPTIAMYAIVLALISTSVIQTGCAAKHPIHAGAVNQVDSDVYDSLLTCQGALEQAKAEFGSNPAAKTTLNQAIVSYNTALDGYLAYKAGRSLDLVAVQAQISNIIQDIGSLKQQFGGGVKKQ